MPLKHATETFLIFLLGVVIAFTGLLVATLPDFPLGMIPGVILLVVTILYPVSLLRLLRRNRADYTFRWLHWMPALMMFVWLILQGLMYFFQPTTIFLAIYTWGWTLPLVTLGFLMIALFCLRVIRRRVVRLVLLTLAFVPFVVAAVVSEQGFNWDHEVAQVLWEGEWWERMYEGISGSGIQVALQREDLASEKNLSVSSDPAEEAWRERLRAFERRRERIASRLDEEEGGTESAASSTASSSQAETGTGKELRQVATMPDALPSAGAGMGAFGLTMLLSYFGVLHVRARRRLTL